MAKKPDPPPEPRPSRPPGRGLRHIRDLKLDPKNRRRRTPRNEAMIVESLQRVGAARSIVLDETDQVLAGNGVVEAAAGLGITRVKIVEADGRTLVAVRRRGLDEHQKRELALYDNRAPELAVWNNEQIAEDQKNGLDLAPFFEDEELRKLLKEPKEATVEEVETTDVADRFWIHLRGPLKQQAFVLQRLRELLKDLDGVVVELGTIAEVTPW